jgi:hypothetical protein
VAEVSAIPGSRLCHFDCAKTNQIDVKRTLLLQFPFKSQDSSQWNIKYWILSATSTRF